MKRKPSVTVGIVAYNEEKNIKNVIASILNQKQEGWQLHEILIYCDGCIDSTAKIAKSIKHTKIKVVESQERKGKAFRIEEIFKQYEGEVLVIFDADIKMKNNLVITELVKGFDSDKSIMLVGGNSQPINPQSFIERSIYTTTRVFELTKDKINKGNNVFNCSGRCFAVKKKLSDSLTLKHVINEDEFIYFSCIYKGYKFNYAKDAVVYNKLPKNLRDYLKQLLRCDPQVVSINNKKIFGKLVDQELKRPFSLYILSVLKVFLEYPLEVIFISLVIIAAQPFIPYMTKNYKLSWYTAESTK